MKHLSFRILFLCVFLPPVLYIFTIQGLEAYLQNTWKSDLMGRLISNPGQLLKGQLSVHDEIRTNIQAYMQSRWIAELGPVVRILVRTKNGRVIYPDFEKQERYEHQPDSGLKSLAGPSESSRLARENLEVMQEGLVFSLAVEIPRNTWLSNSVLVFYILVFTGVLCLSYRSNVRQAENVTRQQEEDLKATQKKLSQAQSRLQEATAKERSYREEIDRQKRDLTQADRRIQITEKEALAEMEALEEKLQESMAKRQEREQEIENLAWEVDRLKSQQKLSSKKKEKQQAAIRKRFNVLYKKIDFHDRSVDGFLHLPEDMQLKAEEFIHTLNQDPGLIRVKRKVFSKNGDLSALESIFAYRGRVYWRKKANSTIEVMAIGTKNTQSKDLAFLEGANAS
ncbi:MAG: hypothetical protein K9K64_13565 [Desulfohalobiaceae bacterium]|nr:hypothetical protein [Desulfohalobiaceae bacterium]